MVIMENGRRAIGFLADANEIFGGDEPACETENDVKCDKAPELQPGKRSAINPDPHGLADDDVGVGGRVFGKALMQIIHNGERGAGERHEKQGEKSPARPDEG